MAYKYSCQSPTWNETDKASQNYHFEAPPGTDQHVNRHQYMKSAKFRMADIEYYKKKKPPVFFNLQQQQTTKNKKGKGNL